MNSTYNAGQAIIAQKKHLKELAKGTPENWMSDSFSKGVGFAPSNGICYRCKRQIYSDGGISVERASVELTTGGYDSFTPYKDVEARLKEVGFDVIVFVPSLDEDNGMITCGNAILSGKSPTSKYKVETY